MKVSASFSVLLLWAWKVYIKVLINEENALQKEFNHDLCSSENV